MRRKKHNTMICELIVLVLLWHHVSAQIQNTDSDSSFVPFEGQISVEARMSRSSIAVGDTVAYIIRLSWFGPSENYVFWPPKTPEAAGLVFSHMQTSNQKKSKIDGYESNTIFRLLFVGETFGETEIGETKIKYLPRGAKDFEYFHIASQKIEVIPRPVEILPLLVKGALIAVLLTALGFGIRKIRRQRKARSQKDPEKTPAQRALEQLALANRKWLEGDVADYYQEIANIIKGFFIEKGVIDGLGRPLDEVLSAIDEADYDDHLKSNIRSILQTCEEIRFSGYLPEPTEIDLFEAKVKEIFRT